MKLKIERNSDMHMKIKTLILQIYSSIIIAIISLILIVASIFYNIFGIAVIGLIFLLYSSISIKEDLYLLKKSKSYQKDYDEYKKERNISDKNG